MLTEQMKKYGFAIILSLIGCLVYSYFVMNRAEVDLSIHVQRRTFFQMFWAKAGEGFSEKRSVKVLVKPGLKDYHFFLTNLRGVDKIRLDPHQYAGKCTIEKLRIVQKGIEPIQLTTNKGLGYLNNRHQVSEYHIDESGLVVYATGKDPFLEGNLVVEKTNFPWLQEISRLFFISLVISCTYFFTNHLNKHLEYSSLLMISVLALVLIMAMISKKNAHPDEHVHIEASKYYQNNWMPPVIEDPAIRSTYSRYGFSRLNSPEIYYFFSGKFAQLVSFMHVKSYLLLRLFNVFLLACIFMYMVRHVGARYIAMPFLITPQIWYVFSYCNSDVFAIFIAFLVGVQVTAPQSTFHVFLRQNLDKNLFFRGIVLGGLVGCLLLLKKNFYPFIAFVACVLAWQLYEIKDKEKRLIFVKRLSVLLLIGMTLFGMRRGADYYVNGIDKAEKITKMRIETADSLLNPTSELSKQHLNLSMKKRGVPLLYLIKVRRFFEKTFRSAFGVYGYLSIHASYSYYDAVRWSGIGLLALFLSLILMNSFKANGPITIIFLTFSLALIGISLLRSWTNDFQAQGRYLFPIVSMLSIVYARNYNFLKGKLFTSGFLVMFFLAVYSYIFVGIAKIPKISLY